MRLDLSHKFVLGFVVVAAVTASLPALLEQVGVPAWGAFFFALGIGAGIGWLYATQLTSNFRTLRSCTERISHGDLTARVALDVGRRFPDETVDLARSISGMLASLRELVEAIQKAANQVAQASRELSDSTHGVSAANQDVVGSMGLLAEGAVRQRDQVGLVTTRVLEISRAMRENAEAARATSSFTAEASQRATAGVQVSRLSAAKMQRLFERVEEAGRDVQKFEQKIQSAHRVTEMISSVVEKTHLLSLNASIEAARAGDAGRGFSVVAEEIRKLAENAGESAAQIEKLIGELEEGSSRISSVTLAMGDEVRGGREDLDRILHTLEQVQSAVEEVSSRSQEIFDQAGRRAGDAESLERDVEKIAGEVTSGSKLADQVRDALAGQAVTLDEMAEQAARLTGMSHELDVVARRFQTRPGRWRE